MNRQPGARLAAWCIDVLCILGWVTVLAVVGVLLYSAGLLRGVSPAVGNAGSFLVLIVPATLALARAESGPREATVGKRVRRLRVADVRTGSRISFGRALLRNTVKVAVPWELGHTVVWALAGTGSGDVVPAWLVLTTVAAYLLPTGYLVTLFVGSGRTPYDRIARTVVPAGTAQVTPSGPPGRS